MQKEKVINISRWALFAVITIIIFLIQNSSGQLLDIKGAKPYMLVPLVVCIGMFEREAVGGAFGLFAGLLWDMVSSNMPGFHALVLMVIGCTSGLLITYIMRNNLLTSILLSICAILIHSILYWLFFILLDNVGQPLYALYRFILPSSLYTLFFTPVFYFLVREIMKKIRIQLPE